MTKDKTPPGDAGLGIWGNIGIWIAFGAAFGLLVGMLFDNIGLGLALGTGLGVAAWAVFIAPRNNAHDDS